MVCVYWGLCAKSNEMKKTQAIDTRFCLPREWGYGIGNKRRKFWKTHFGGHSLGPAGPETSWPFLAWGSFLHHRTVAPAEAEVAELEGNVNSRGWALLLFCRRVNLFPHLENTPHQGAGLMRAEGNNLWRETDGRVSKNFLQN